MISSFLKSIQNVNTLNLFDCSNQQATDEKKTTEKYRKNPLLRKMSLNRLFWPINLWFIYTAIVFRPFCTVHSVVFFFLLRWLLLFFLCTVCLQNDSSQIWIDYQLLFYFRQNSSSFFFVHFRSLAKNENKTRVYELWTRIFLLTWDTSIFFLWEEAKFKQSKWPPICFDFIYISICVLWWCKKKTKQLAFEISWPIESGARWI